MMITSPMFDFSAYFNTTQRLNLLPNARILLSTKQKGLVLEGDSFQGKIEEISKRKVKVLEKSETEEERI
jgi:hypothetical protein